ncbi:SDR family NAD(P)-dependent oxidoreductase [Kutzneria albida]|uniref:Short-chain dehydrogenase/reductase sdr n=1 Tax=Kutzneria albida DSM 43870 TaxID=1449976 RepID=W5W4A4_9PSEU|nr:SDR family oxidoreductase [Kutzneria albida]AHH95662.1 short-chain dehydrogenase/reductase sdr [Kutzneria albida DSM 43870]
MTGRAVLVTGGSGGVGAAVARGFAEAGDRVVVHYVTSRERAEQVLSGLPGEGHHVLGADPADPAQAEGLVEGAVGLLGGLDVLVNSVGLVKPYHPVLESTYQQWHESFELMTRANLLGPANLIYCAVRHLPRGGRIVNVGSRGAHRGTPMMPGYGAAKAGLHALTQTLSQSLGTRGISVTAVAPGVIDTAMAEDLLTGPDAEAIRAQSPFGRVATAEEVAGAVLYLASPGAEFASGTIIDINGASYFRS